MPGPEDRGLSRGAEGAGEHVRKATGGRALEAPELGREPPLALQHRGGPATTEGWRGNAHASWADAPNEAPTCSLGKALSSVNLNKLNKAEGSIPKALQTRVCTEDHTVPERTILDKERDV